MDGFDLLLTLLVGADGRGGRMGALLAQQQFGGVRGPFLERILPLAAVLKYF